MKSRRRSDRQKGFSLVEVLCALLLLGVGLVGITEGITVALRSNKEAEQHTMASLLAGSRLEFLRADGFFVPGEESGEFGAGFEGYLWQQNITETQLAGLYEIRVAVLAASAATPTPLYELTTLLFKKPLESLYQETKDEMERRRTSNWERVRRQVKR